MEWMPLGDTQATLVATECRPLTSDSESERLRAMSDDLSVHQ